MSRPDDIGVITQSMGLSKGHEFFDWHNIPVKSPQCSSAGRWLTENIHGNWTFRDHPGQIIFYIEDDQDAMMFKLMWGNL